LTFTLLTKLKYNELQSKFTETTKKILSMERLFVFTPKKVFNSDTYTTQLVKKIKRGA
jgi:hypothetical protein